MSTESKPPGSTPRHASLGRIESADAWLAAIVDAADDAIISKDLLGTIISWNPAAERLFGYSAAEVIGKSITLLLPPDRLDEEPAILARVSTGERIDHYETVRRHKDGSLIEVSITVSAVRNADGVIVGASKIARGLSEKRAAEDIARRLAAIVDSSDDAILSKDLTGIIRSWNPGAEKLFGYTASEVIGKPVTMLIPLGRYNEEPEILARIKSGERIEHYETVRRRKDGTLFDVSLTVSPVRNALGHVVGASKIVRDVSDRKQSDTTARRLAAIVESSDDAIVSKNLQGIIQSWNRGAEKLFGYSASEAIGQSVLMLIPEGRRDEEPAIIQRLVRGERVEHYETIRRRKDGVLIEVSLTVSPIIDVRGRVTGASKIARDITEQKRVLRELREMHDKALAANRAKDDFLAALSHELRTPLNPVLLVASEGAADTALPEAVRHDFESIRKHVELEARLIDDLLDLSRIAKGKLELTMGTQDLRTILREAIATVQPDLEAKNQVLNADLSTTPLAISGDRVRLQQVLWNVLKNAVKFTPDHGAISITTRINTVRRCAVVEITDTGIGLQANELERIFDAFTQSQLPPSIAHRFGGLGLGLTISKLITEMHHGSIHALSEGPGRGATFVIELPLAEIEDGVAAFAANPPPVAALPSTAPATPKVRILLVEDHDESRAVMTRLLTRRGFEVVQAAAAGEARALAAAQTFNLMISDVGLPDGNGCDLIAEFRQKYQLPGIALTGYGMEEDVKRSRDAGAVAHLTKPISIASLELALKDRSFDRAKAT